MPSAAFDFSDPDYDAILQERMERLAWLRKQGQQAFDDLFLHYGKDYGPIDFIDDWGVTFDPRKLEVGEPALLPFVLFQKQRDWLKFTIDNWHDRQNGVTAKSRDSGVSWLSVGLGCGLCNFNRGVVVGYGSRKREYVDEANQPKSLFFKARMFMDELPVEFRRGWDRFKHAPQNRIVFPATGSYMTGEIGDQIGRGDRATVYFVDEAGFLEHPELVERSLSQTTNCRQDISTPNGVGNPFERKYNGGKVRAFTFHWRDDPRKNEAWYAKQVEELDPITIAQEIDIDFSASVTGVLIPQVWVRAAVDACEKLGIVPSGESFGGLDVADEGKDLNAFCGAKGVHIEELQEWSGKGDDIFGTVERAFHICHSRGYRKFRYDADGLGAGVRGDARVLNEAMRKNNLPPVTVVAHRGSAGVLLPQREDVPGRKNLDYFKNFKAQASWALRTRFLKTFRWVREGKPCDTDEIISIPSTLPNFTKLISELSQPTYATDKVGKVQVNKKPDGAKSPNLFDAVVIRFAPGGAGFAIPDDLLSNLAKGARR